MDGDAERAFAKIIDEVHPDIHAAEELAGLDRASLAAMFERAGLAVVRHTVVTHPLVFQRAERFAMSLQGVDNVYDLQWASGVKYRDVRFLDEVQQSKYAFGQVTLADAR